MKKSLKVLLALSLMVGMVLGSLGLAPSVSAEETEIDTLHVAFVPSRDPEEIMTTTEPLKQLLIDELAKSGYKVNEVEITVGTNYEAVGEGMAAGTIDVGLIPGGTYVLFEDDVDVVLTATRDGVKFDSEEPKDWNVGEPNEEVDNPVTYYHGIIVAGPSEKGQELADKVNSGEELTWEDLDSAKWAVMSSSSSSGYIYPTIWLSEHYDGHHISDLSQVVQSESYNSSLSRLAAEQVDVIVGFGDLRIDQAQAWEDEMGREATIWEETNVIGVTPKVYNDTVSVSKHSEVMTPEFQDALADAFINLAKTPEGLEAISIYSHKGYQRATPEDYETEREAQRLLRELNN